MRGVNRKRGILESLRAIIVSNLMFIQIFGYFAISDHIKWEINISLFIKWDHGLAKI